MSRDEYFDAGGTATSSPIPHRSIFEPDVNPPRRRIRACIDAGVWTSGFLPIRFTSSLSCNAASVNCGFGDRASATNGHRTVLSAALRRTSLARWLERNCSGRPASPTRSLTSTRHVHPARCTSRTEPSSSPGCVALEEPGRAPHIGSPFCVAAGLQAKVEQSGAWRTDNRTDIMYFYSMRVLQDIKPTAEQLVILRDAATGFRLIRGGGRQRKDHVGPDATPAALRGSRGTPTTPALARFGSRAGADVQPDAERIRGTPCGGAGGGVGGH